MKKRNFKNVMLNSCLLACSRETSFALPVLLPQAGGTVQTALSYKFAPLAGETARSAKGGFTLAEVLITLVIIGVIGALTVPALIQNTQKQEFVSGLKTAYSTLSQAVNMIIAEEGSPKSGEGWSSQTVSLHEMLKKHLNIVKECENSEDCINWKWSYLSSKTQRTFSSIYSGLVLSSGMALAVRAYGSCNAETTGITKSCGEIIVDVNGEKGPNILGRDLFQLHIKESGLYPRGCEGTTAGGPLCFGSTSGGYGRGEGWDCACKVLTEGAMNY